MSNLSFSFNPSNNEGTTVSLPNSQSVRLTSPRQVQYYLDLCAQRGVTPKNYIGMKYEELDTLIQELKNFYPASPKQIEMIQEKIASLQELGININAPNYATLTGGREGTASKLIETLILKEQELNGQRPPSEDQIKFMVSMFLCPDVPFEDYGVTRKIDLEDGLWRRPTPEEFAQSILDTMKRNDASLFLDTYRSAFNEWRKTRIRPEQQKFIRELESRLANTSTTTTVEWAIDQDGNLVQVQKQVTDKSREWNPQGYTPLDEMELLQFSVEEASKYIDQLKDDIKRKDNRSSEDTSITHFEELRKTKTVDAYHKEQFKKLQDLIFKLEAIAGYENPDVHECATMLVAQDLDDESTKKCKQTIREFIMYLLKEDYITFEGLVEVCKEVDVAQDLITGAI